MPPNFPDLQQIRAEKARRKLSEFVGQAWHVLEPETDYKHGWHIGAICEHLEAVSSGQIKKLVINVPPGHMKSLTTCVFWNAWDWIDKPYLRWLFASYAGHLSVRDSRKTRDLVLSPWYQDRWGDRFSLTKETEAYIETSKTGFRVATSTGGMGTGERVHRAVNDDLLRANDARSDAMREQAIEHLRAMSTRGVSPKDFAQVLIMQRLHEGDPTGWVLEQGGWDHLCLPAEFEPAKISKTSIGWRDPRNVAGELLWPEQFGPVEIADIKKALGSYGASGQLQQRPSPAEGGIFKKAWWKYYQREDLPEKFDEVLASWDCAFKGTDESDFVVGQVWGKHGANRYLLGQIRGRFDFPATLTAFRRLATDYPLARLKLVEDKANGPAVISTLKNEIPGIVAVNPEGGKEARANAMAPEVEAGNVYLPHPMTAPWVEDFVEEFAVFPNGSNDDQVDAASQALLRFNTRGTTTVTPLRL